VIGRRLQAPKELYSPSSTAETHTRARRLSILDAHLQVTGAIISRLTSDDRHSFHYGSSGTYLPVKEKTMASVTFDAATRLYPGSTRPAVDALNLEVADGEFLVLVGPSGCGKSTSLRMLAGLEEVNAGRILIGDRDVTDIPPKDRDIAMVFQNYALYPHMTVAENMGFALKIAGIAKEDRANRVLEAAKLLDLEPYLNRKPKALSGGQRQRVAMGRAIVRQPQVFLMDEPLSNLDAKLRVQTRTQIASLQRRLGVTTVYVTHDQTEALTMGDRIAVLKDGVLQQVGTPRDLYERPNNVFVAGFIGSPAMNLFPADLTDGGVKFGSQLVNIDRAVVSGATGSQVTVGVRPEDVIVSTTQGEGLQVTVDLVEELGADGYLYGHSEVEGHRTDIVARVDGRLHPTAGDTVFLTPQPGHLHVFDVESGSRLGNMASAR
jgi:multiple sugar transport system ATP-binding protein